MSPDVWRGLTLALGVGGGVAAASIQMPLAWMLGPMTIVTVAALAGAPMQGIASLRRVMLVVLGVALGSSARPEMLARLGDWALSLIVTPFYLFAVGALSWLLLLRVAKLDAATAYYGAMPGGLAEMILLGAQQGGDGRKLAALHASRILFVVFLIPILFAVAGHPIPQRLGPLATLTAPWPGAADLAALCFLGLVGLLVGERIKLPAAALLGPMMVSAVAHAGGWIVAAPPTALVAAAQIVIGCGLGARFAGGSTLDTLRMMGWGGGLALLMVGAATLVAGAWGPKGGDMAVAAVLLAYAPGGLTEMSLIALMFGLDPTFVAVHHLLRVALVIGLAQPLRRLIPNAAAASSPSASPPASPSDPPHDPTACDVLAVGRRCGGPDRPLGPISGGDDRG